MKHFKPDELLSAHQEEALQKSLPPLPGSSRKAISLNITTFTHTETRNSNDRDNVSLLQTFESSCNIADDDVVEVDNSKKEVLAKLDPFTARKCAISNYYFLDYYFELLTYIHHRKQRTQHFKNLAIEKKWSDERWKQEWKEYTIRESAYLRQKRSRTNLTQFHILAQIGQGGYGQVFLARKKDTKEICALKKMNKITLSKMNEIDHILTERDVLTQTRTPWLTKLLYAFQDCKFVYLAMEYVPGGDLRTLLNKMGTLNEHDAQFYIAEMFTATDELHRLGYIHRDLKPENFLVDSKGHLKLTDFGLSTGKLTTARLQSLKEKLIAVKNQKLVPFSSAERRQMYRSYKKEDATRAFTLVGSPDYMAPEILSLANNKGKSGVYASGYDYLVDYWSLGCILFEILAGYPPFAGPSVEDVWVNVYHWQEILERPRWELENNKGIETLSDDAWDLISRLITHRHLRISNISHVHHHPWFHRLNETIKNHMLTVIPRPAHSAYSWISLNTIPDNVVSPPFIPELESELDHKNFDDFTDPTATEIYKEVFDKQRQIDDELGFEASDGGANIKLRNVFVGFTYKHKQSLNW